jgi:hypothetical protein
MERTTSAAGFSRYLPGIQTCKATSATERHLALCGSDREGKSGARHGFFDSSINSERLIVLRENSSGAAGGDEAM